MQCLMKQSPQLTKEMAAIVLEKFAPNLEKLSISRTECMKGMMFPKLKVLHCGSPGSEEVGGRLIVDCPLLAELSVHHCNRDAGLIENRKYNVRMKLPIRMTFLTIDDYCSTLDDYVSQLVDLKHLSITSYFARMTNAFFNNMYHLR